MANYDEDLVLARSVAAAAEALNVQMRRARETGLRVAPIVREDDYGSPDEIVVLVSRPLPT